MNVSIIKVLSWPNPTLLPPLWEGGLFTAWFPIYQKAVDMMKLIRTLKKNTLEAEISHS